MVVYRIYNTKNNRIYIGSTNNWIARKAEHTIRLRENRHHNKYLQKDFNIYGESVFEFLVLIDGFGSRQEMMLKEYELILKYEGLAYNIDTSCPVIQTRKIKESKKKKKCNEWKNSRCPKWDRKTVDRKKKSKPKPKNNNNDSHSTIMQKKADMAARRAEVSRAKQ